MCPLARNHRAAICVRARPFPGTGEGKTTSKALSRSVATMSRRPPPASKTSRTFPLHTSGKSISGVSNSGCNSRHPLLQGPAPGGPAAGRAGRADWWQALFAQPLLQGAQDFALLGVSPGLLLGVYESVVQSDFNYPPARWDQSEPADTMGQSLQHLFRQPGGFRQVASRGAVFDADLRLFHGQHLRLATRGRRRLFRAQPKGAPQDAAACFSLYLISARVGGG